MVLRQSCNINAFIKFKSYKISHDLNHKKNFNTTKGICKNCQNGAKCSYSYTTKNRRKKREMSCFEKVAPNISFNFQGLG